MFLHETERILCLNYSQGFGKESLHFTKSEEPLNMVILFLDCMIIIVWFLGFINESLMS